MMADMMGFTVFPVFFVLMFVLVASVFVFNLSTQVRNRRVLERNRQHDVLDARARAQRWIDRLGGEIMLAEPEDEQAKQLVGLAAQRHAGALGQITLRPDRGAGPGGTGCGAGGPLLYAGCTHTHGGAGGTSAAGARQLIRRR